MPLSLACLSTLDSVVPSIAAITSTLAPLVTMFSIWESWFGISSSAYCRSVLYPRCFSTLTMLLPSSIQRAEALVGIAMPTVGLPCASAGLENATEPATTADRTDLSSFMFHSQVLDVSRGLSRHAPCVSFPGARREKGRGPFLDVVADEVGKFFRRAAERDGTLPL